MEKEVSNDEIIIQGKSFKKADVEDIGKKLANRRTNKFRWTGAAFLSAGLTFIIFGITDLPSTTALLVIGIILFILGAIFFPVSFKKRDPIKFGTAYYQRQLAVPNAQATNVAAPANQLTILTGRTIQISRKPLVRIIFNGDENKLQIFSERRYSKIYSKNEVLDYELRVDNELVITSASKKGMGKSIAMGAIGHGLFGAGGAGMVAGSVGASQKTKSSQKEIHHYTLLIKVKDINKASYYMNVDTVQIAEEAITMLDIIIGKTAPKEIEEQKASGKEEKLNKFEEIKKYKELLDSGIISEDEFNQKKKELL